MGFVSDAQRKAVWASRSEGPSAAKRDACYHKVKRAVKKWPSAYASGQLVQCRKKGASNWGTSKK